MKNQEINSLRSSAVVNALFLIFLFLSSCGKKENSEDCHHFLTIKNNSDIVFYAVASSSYPDTTIFPDIIPNPLYNEGIYRVNAYSINTDAVEDLENCIEIHFNTAVQGRQMDTMMVFLFREDSLKANDWTDAPNYVLRRYDLTLADLDAMNWTITYP